METLAVVVVAGPAGSGKTTVGRALAVALGAAFIDGDDLHPAANKEKMRSGVPLDDEDRRPWLEALRAVIDHRLAAGDRTVVASSALRRSYRQDLGVDRPGIQLVWLDADHALLADRLSRRQGHFFAASLAASQLATAERPSPEEGALIIEAGRDPDEVVDTILAGLGQRG